MAVSRFAAQEKTLGIDEIFKDDSIYPREKIDEKRIEFFSDLMKEGTFFPNIKIVKDKSGKFILLDGFHRYSALKKLEHHEIPCDLIDADPSMWRLLSVRFNFDSSQPLKFGEIKKAIFDTWLKDNIRDKQQIADMLGCSVQWVRKVTRELDQDEDDEKLAMARKIKEEENSSIRDIADKVGWSKSKTHRMLNQPAVDNEPTVQETRTEPPAGENIPERAAEPQNHVEPEFIHAEKIIENFNKFDHHWEPDQKETLYALDGIKKNLPVEAISKHSGKNPNWIRNAAYVLLALHHQNERGSEQLFQVSEKLAVNIERTHFINYLFTHWKNILPERKALFQWVLNNQTPFGRSRKNHHDGIT
jgi:ParB-like chromosome segregation protein Spo0J